MDYSVKDDINPSVLSHIECEDLAKQFKNIKLLQKMPQKHIFCILGVFLDVCIKVIPISIESKTVEYDYVNKCFDWIL